MLRIWTRNPFYERETRRTYIDVVLSYLNLDCPAAGYGCAVRKREQDQRQQGAPQEQNLQVGK